MSRQVQIKVALLSLGKLDLACRCMVDIIRRSHPWVTAAIKVELVRQGHAKVCAQARMDSVFWEARKLPKWIEAEVCAHNAIIGFCERALQSCRSCHGLSQITCVIVQAINGKAHVPYVDAAALSRVPLT